MLTGTDSFSAFAPITYESKAVRTAKAAFTLDPTTPPWKDPDATDIPLSTQVSSITAMKTIIDKAGLTSDTLTNDVQTSFTAYKALDRLRALAEAATATTASAAQRTALQKTFAKGLADLQTYLAGAPTDQLSIAFGKPSTTVKSAPITSANLYEVQGDGLVTNRADPLPDLTGQEKFSLSLTRPGSTENLTVDLSQGPQPPTIDSVVNALNAAITTTPALDADGNPRLNSKGEVVSKWSLRFVAEKQDDKWAIKLESPDGLEQVTMDQIGAKDALVVATGQTPLDAPTSTQVFRFDDPAGDNTRTAMGTIAALDRQATDQAVMAGRTTTTTSVKTNFDGTKTTEKTTTSNVYANTDAAAVATDAQGNSYVVGTTKGDLGANRSDGDDNLFLTKLDGDGNVVWQRSLGAAGSSTGAAVSIGADGSVVVAGTVNGAFDGTTSDGDMVVAKYAANGDEKFSTVVHSVGADTAKAVAIGADGSVFVGGKVRGGTEGDVGDAFVARIDPTGKLAERRTIASAGSDTINGLAVDGDGNVLALVSQDGVAQVRKLQGSSLATELGSIDLGTADARAIAVAADGTIAVGGAASAALNGTQVNGISGGRDGFVARIDSGMTGASVTYLGSSEDDQVDSIAFMGNDLYAGGRTTGDMGAARKGPTDGFVSRIDAATGAIQSTSQFGQPLLRTEPVRIAADVGGASAVSALGFGRGTINPQPSDKVTTQTALREGDSFSFKADDGAVRKITIEADDTMQTIAKRLQGMLGASKATVTAPTVNGQQTLSIVMKPDHDLQLLSGPAGSDALFKLGMEPQRIAADAPVPASAPKVRPGGTFGLDLNEAFNISTLDDAKVVLAKINDAISMTQTAYRSLYWDDTKASMVDGVKNTATGKQSTAIEKAQLANYQAALSRLMSAPTGIIGL
ncbi:hypothetical protein [Sphingomonas sp. dw_22]|uniref:hypothetical protein n=1 Tax=Sphingomonas sp. dw_22 TaxID=2721175 RepID=UPI001BD6DDEB|nr:hypothetical protein [Sphingomonas sp. dw_22]